LSRQLIDRSPDLRKLVEEGYELDVRGAYLVIQHVPYVDADKKVRLGELVMQLTLAGEQTTRPSDHVAYFAGSEPCDSAGRRLSKIINGEQHNEPAPGVKWEYMFSAHPQAGEWSEYPDYYAKVTTYVAMLSSHAQRIDESVTARTYEVVKETDSDSPFLYTDTATPRAGLDAINSRLRGDRIAIVGLGGTGSYILDFVAKTLVAEIHLFDGDRYLQHNAFRGPGATPIEELTGGPNKAEHWAAIYGRMRRGVVPHPYRIDAETADELAGMDFVFVALDDGPSRALVVSALEQAGVAFIDVGMGLYAEEAIGGQMRTSISEPAHPCNRTKIPVGATDPDNVYKQNVQIVEANALHAALAVIRWKKFRGLYVDLGHEGFSIYALETNTIISEDVW
jgi:molybdopterin/thiamine biosynthesis adenylyltransferase